MSQNPQINDLFHATAYDSSGEKLGAVKQVYLDNRTGQPSFIEVSHGLFGRGESMVPLRGSRLEGERLSLAFPKERISEAPDLDSDDGMTGEQENRLLQHYGVAAVPEASDYHDSREAGDRDGSRDHDGRSDREEGAGDTFTRGSELGATTTDDVRTDDPRSDQEPQADESTRSGDTPEVSVTGERAVEEVQDLGGEYRLRKYQVTEIRTIEVPVTREEVRLERVNEDGTVTPVDDTHPEAERRNPDEGVDPRR